MDPATAQDLVDWRRPTNQKQVEEILGLWNVDQRFIPNNAQIVRSIMNLLKGNMKHVVFAESQEAVFHKVVI
jgi:hypothetical protein